MADDHPTLYGGSPEPGFQERVFGIEHKGRDLGHIEVVHDKQTKTLHIRNIALDDGPNSLGAEHVRHLYRQLKDRFPDAERITGERVSGARRKSGTTSQVNFAFRSK